MFFINTFTNIKRIFNLFILKLRKLYYLSTVKYKAICGAIFFSIELDVVVLLLEGQTIFIHLWECYAK